jgi:hypothetical protein
MTKTYELGCVLVGNANRLLGKSATLKEKFVLGGTRFYDDTAITHYNHEYFDKIYETFARCTTPIRTCQAWRR